MPQSSAQVGSWEKFWTAACTRRPLPSAARAPACCPCPPPASAPPRLLGGFAGNGRRFCHGSGLLVCFWQALRGADFADLGKRWCYAAFRAESACKTAQKSRMSIVRARRAFGCVGAAVDCLRPSAHRLIPRFAGVPHQLPFDVSGFRVQGDAAYRAVSL